MGVLSVALGQVEGASSATTQDSGRRSGTFVILRGSTFPVALFLLASGCSPPSLIENGALNHQRVNDVIERASNASEMRVIHPLSVQLIGRDEVSRLLQEEATTVFLSDDWAPSQAGRAAIGLFSGFNGEITIRLALLARTTVGFYIAEKKTLYMIDELAGSATGNLPVKPLGPRGQEYTLVHGAISALQHQHYPILYKRQETHWRGQADASLALKAAKEGHAEFWATQSMGLLGRARDPKDVIEASRDAVGSFTNEPAHVREFTSFPYTYGYQFAFYEGKAALASPPASTEQLLHYAHQRPDFLAIDVSAFARFVQTEGCRVFHQDTMGELTLALWFRAFDSTLTQNVWDGWDGDRWIAADCKNGREIAWLTSWDTEKDAMEFERAIVGITGALQTRLHLQSLVVGRHGREVIVASGALGSKTDELEHLAKRMRVTTRAELAAHFSSPE